MLKSVTFLVLALVLAVAIGQSSSNKRAYVAGKFALEIDGVLAALNSCDGTSSDVIQDAVSADGIVRKHIAGVKYGDITVTCGAGMSKGFYEWIKASFDNGNVRKNGAVIAADCMKSLLPVGPEWCFTLSNPLQRRLQPHRNLL